MMSGVRVWVPRIVAAALAVGMYAWAPTVVEASPITVVSANVWRADRTPNPIGFPTTALVPWVEVNTLAGGDVNQTFVTASIEGTTYNLQRIPTGVLAGIYFAQIPYDISLDSAWTITATNGANSTEIIRPAFVPITPMPFVSEIGFTGTGTDITVHWTVTPEGEARLDQQQVTIWDITTPGSFFTSQFFPIGSAPRQVTLTNLALGRLYAVEINNVDINQNGFTDAFSGNWLTGWSPTQGEVQLPPPSPVPEPATISLLLTGLAGAGLRRLRRRSKS